MNTQEILEQARREMLARRTEAAARRDQPWLYAFIGVALTFVVGIWLLPGNTLADRLHLAVQGVCAQAHYLFIGQLKLPLCARNTGIYAGFLGTVLYLVALGRGRAGRLPPLPITVLLALGVVAMGIDGTNSLLLDLGDHNLYQPQNFLRLITGLLMGTAIGVFLPLILNLALRENVRADQAMLGSWPEYLGALLADAVLFMLVTLAPAPFFYPIAIFSVVGIIGVLFTTNVFVVAMVSGLEQRTRKLRQLARPATIALVLTALELGGLAWLRTVIDQGMTMH